VSFSSLCGHGSDGSHGAGVARVGGQALNTPTAALLNVGISTSTPTSTYARRDNTILRKCSLKNYELNEIQTCKIVDCDVGPGMEGFGGSPWASTG
jgi:NAD(P)H-hydrate repair Nnr-like enzyme with NAD(P)H-hydrate epimerase domain